MSVGNQCGLRCKVFDENTTSQGWRFSSKGRRPLTLQLKDGPEGDVSIDYLCGEFVNPLIDGELEESYSKLRSFFENYSFLWRKLLKT